MSENEQKPDLGFGPEWLRRAFDIGRRILRLEDEVPVSRPIASKEVRQSFDLEIAEEGQSLESVMDDLNAIASASPRTSSHRFFNQLYGGRDHAAAAAELVATIVNTSMYTHKIAGVNADIEDFLTEKLARMAGYEDGEGCICPGGSISNLLSVVLARDFWPTKNPGAPEAGAFKIYTSALCHYSIRKNAGITGIGKSNVRKVPTDSRGRMKADALRAMVEEDLKNGARPLMVNATAGTTVLAAFDPIDEISPITHEFGMWLHVDGALGGAMLFSDTHKGLLKGLEGADSFSWNAHKMMGVPLTCSALIVKHKNALRQSLEEDADYLFQSDDQSMDLGIKSIQCGRRNDALKLWATWRHHGNSGFGKKVDHLIKMARLVADAVKETPTLELVAEPESVNVCFKHEKAPAAWICRQLEVDQIALVSHALVNGEEIIRVPFVNPELNETDVRALLDGIVTLGATWSA